MKKILSLITLLVAIVTGAKATDYNFTSLTADPTISSTAHHKASNAQNVFVITDGVGKDKICLQKVGSEGFFKNDVTGGGTNLAQTKGDRYLSLIDLKAGDAIVITYTSAAAGTSNGDFTIENSGSSSSTNLSTTKGGDAISAGTKVTSGATYYVLEDGYVDFKTTKNFYLTNISITADSGKTALTGEWSNAAPEFAIGSTATIPTFTVTGGTAELGTDYTVEYTKTDASDIVTLSGGNGVITAINTNAAATATVTATVTVVNTTKYEIATASYDCNITIADIKSASDLAVAAGKGTINTTVGAENYTLTQNTDFTTSSDGAISYASSIPGVAYVDASTGELQFKGAGTTTITLTQAESATYEEGSVTFTVNVLPSACLNLGDKDEAVTQLKKGWAYDSPYFDTENKLVIIGAYAAYGSGNQGYQNWIATSMNTSDKSDPDDYTVGGTSNKGAWSASAPFIGNSGYYRDDSESKVRYATTNSSRPWTVYKFRVKGITAAQAYVKGNNDSRYVTIAAYEITDGALAATAAKSANSSGSSAMIITCDELDSSKEYLITVGNTVYSSNLDFYEIAFTASASDIEIPSNRITTSAAGWASYTPMYNVSATIYKPGSSSAASDIKMYTVESVTGGDATMHEVTSSTEKGMKAENGYFLKGAANTVYRTTATNNNVTVPETNLIKAATETANVKSDASKTRYALLTYDADNYGLYKLNSTGVTMPAGRAYLEIDASSSNPASLDMQFDEATAISNVDANDNVKTVAPVKVIKNGKLYIGNYNVAGQLVK